MESREWWKNVDLISQRRRSTNVSLDRETAEDLNEFSVNCVRTAITSSPRYSKLVLKWKSQKLVNDMYGTH